jgi:hypothetical protein
METFRFQFLPKARRAEEVAAAVVTEEDEEVSVPCFRTFVPDFRGGNHNEFHFYQIFCIMNALSLSISYTNY